MSHMRHLTLGLTLLFAFLSLAQAEPPGGFETGKLTAQAEPPGGFETGKSA